MSAKQTMNKIEVKNVFKVFGARAEDALQLIRQKKPKIRSWPKPAAWSGSTICRCPSAAVKSS